jgi:hypothetical protein
MSRIHMCDKSHTIYCKRLLLPLTTKYLFANMRLVLFYIKPYVSLRLNNVISFCISFVGNKWR